jgi:hypothetical protein
MQGVLNSQVAFPHADCVSRFCHSLLPLPRDHQVINKTDKITGNGSGTVAAAAAVAAAQQQEGIECPIFIEEIIERFLRDVKIAEDLATCCKSVGRRLFRGIVARGSRDGRKPTINQMDYTALPKMPCQ